MRLIQKLLIGTVALCMGAAAMAATIDIAGVKVEDKNKIAGVDVPLNGAGIRVKFFKIYVGELYTSKKVHTLEELVAAPGPKRLRMTFLRDIDPTSFGRLLTKGVQDNVPKEQLSRMVPGLIRMGEIFANNKSLPVGSVITNDWIPGTGMVTTVNGKSQGAPFDEDFFRGFMAIWFGQNPGDWKLKDAMLDTK
jgi:hypothetical protein